MNRKEIKLIAIIKMLFSLGLSILLLAGSFVLSYSESYVRTRSDMSRYHLDKIDGLQGLVDTYVSDPAETIFRYLELAILILLVYYVISFFLANGVRRRISKNRNHRFSCFLLAIWLLLPFVYTIIRYISYRSIPLYAPVLVIMGINVIYSLYFLSAAFTSR